jgi:hypothetical protein
MLNTSKPQDDLHLAVFLLLKTGNLLLSTENFFIPLQRDNVVATMSTRSTGG